MLGSRYILKKIGWALLTILFVIVLNFWCHQFHSPF